MAITRASQPDRAAWRASVQLNSSRSSLAPSSPAGIWEPGRTRARTECPRPSASCTRRQPVLPEAPLTATLAMPICHWSPRLEGLGLPNSQVTGFGGSSWRASTTSLCSTSRATPSRPSVGSYCRSGSTSLGLGSRDWTSNWADAAGICSSANRTSSSLRFGRDQAPPRPSLSSNGRR